jgi:hypothetical protein
MTPNTGRAKQAADAEARIRNQRLHRHGAAPSDWQWIVSDVLHAGAEHPVNAFGEAADHGVSHEPRGQCGRAAIPAALEDSSRRRNTSDISRPKCARNSSDTPASRTA